MNLRDLLPLATFAFVMLFTPGPNNISSAGMGLAHGYRGTLKYLSGIAAGFFLMMLASALLSASLLEAYPWLERGLRYAGAVYILYLAYATLQSSYGFGEGQGLNLGFINGLLLQLLNPKTIVFGFTIFSTFLADLAGQPLGLGLAALVFGLAAFTSASTWTLFGAAISQRLRQRRARLAANVALALLLVYSAVELAGIL